MKNRFFVINKEKIYAYVVSIMTVVVIFFMSSMMNSDLKETEEVSANDTKTSTMNQEITSNDTKTSTMNQETYLNDNKSEQNSEIGEAVSTSVSNMEENENSNSNETEETSNTEQ